MSTDPAATPGTPAPPTRRPEPATGPPYTRVAVIAADRRLGALRRRRRASTWRRRGRRTASAAASRGSPRRT